MKKPEKQMMIIQSDKFHIEVIREQKASCDKILGANFLEDLKMGLMPKGYV